MSREKHGKRYTEEFKQQLVDLYHAGTSVLELSREYGPSTVTIYKWINDRKVIEMPGGDNMTAKELERLQKEIHELRLENEILKKAAVIFAKDD